MSSDAPTLYRNDVLGGRRTHLFDAEDVDAAGGGETEPSDERVRTLCGSAHSFGPFQPVAPDRVVEHAARDDVCKRCVGTQAFATAVNGDAGDDHVTTEGDD